MSAIYQQEQLLEITGCRTVSDLITHLIQAGVEYNRIGIKGRVYTTHEAINVSLGIRSKGREVASNKNSSPVITVD